LREVEHRVRRHAREHVIVGEEDLRPLRPQADEARRVPRQVLHHRVEVFEVQRLAFAQRAQPLRVDVARPRRAAIGVRLHLVKRLHRHPECREEVVAVLAQQRREARITEHLLAIGVVNEHPRPALFGQQLRVAEVIEVPVTDEDSRDALEVEAMGGCA
jgi:hypothetical protein